MSSADRVEQELRESARLHVRSGLLDEPGQHQAMVASIQAQVPDTDAAILARAWLAGARRELEVESASWVRPTDHDRLVQALDECRRNGVGVLLGADDPDAVRRRAAAAPEGARGLVSASTPAVFHAVDHGVLDLVPWRVDGTRADASDHLVTALLGCFERYALRARWYEGRVQVAVRWQRVP